MSGHSRYANIRHRKGAADARRSRVFSRISREITTAVALGGSDSPAENPRLRVALKTARQENMPGANIRRAILRASGISNAGLQEGCFEGYGPGGVGVVVDTATDNANRTAMSLRNHFRRHGGTLARQGALQAIFRRLGVVVLDTAGQDIDALSLDLIDAGADELTGDGGRLTVTCLPAQLSGVLALLSRHDITPESAELGWIPMLRQRIEAPQHARLQRLLDALMADEDVVTVTHNASGM